MRLRRHPIPLSLLLACLVSLSSATVTDSLKHVADVAEGKVARYGEAAADVLASTSEALASKPTIVAKDGTKDNKISSNLNPVDGKDGRPHTGPFVETSADRDRKKAKDSGDEDRPATGKKPGPVDPTDSDGSTGPLPKSNDGIMDDPARELPKEGTRGTEGGISEKSRQRQGNLGEDVPKKTPEEPKEAPPLPHSEQKEIASTDGKETKSSKPSKDGTVSKPVDDEPVDQEASELAGLTVSALQ
jgi:hypothetical protein